MASKSSYKSGSRILTNTIFGGLGLIAAIGKEISSSSTSDSLDILNAKPEHFSPQKQKLRFILLGAAALMCPIIGCIVFEVADWWMFFSVLVFGFFEMAIVVFILPYGDTKYYIYEDEKDIVDIKCKRNLIILRALFIVLLIFNLYPLILLILDFTSFSSFLYTNGIYILGWDGGELLGLNLILISIKLFINAMLIKEAFSPDTDIWKGYYKVLTRSVPLSTMSKEENNQITKPTQIDNTPSDKTIPKKGCY